MRPDQQLLPGAEAARPADESLQAQGRRGSAAEEAVRAHRIGDPHAPLERLGIVVGHLVGGEVGPHLQDACARIARARAREKNAEGDRRRRGRRGDDGRREPEAAADERRRHPEGERRVGSRADGGGGAHGVRSAYRPGGSDSRPPRGAGAGERRLGRESGFRERKTFPGLDVALKAAYVVVSSTSPPGAPTKPRLRPSLPVRTAARRLRPDPRPQCRSSACRPAPRSGPAWPGAPLARPPRRARRSRPSARRPPDATARRAPSGRRAPPSPRPGRRARSSRVATKPSPSRSTAWWWCDLVAWHSSPQARAASDPGASRTSWSAPSNEPRWRRWSPWPTSSGRCWISVPPRATFMSCIPRQMPSSGRSSSSARRASGISAASRSGFVPVVQRCALGAVAGRVDVRAAGQDQPVEPGEHAVRIGRVARVGRDHQAQRTRLLDGVDVRAREQERLALPDRPARRLEGGADTDAHAPHTRHLPPARP